MLDRLLNNPIASIIGGAGDIIDNLHTSDAEKAEAKLKLTALLDAPHARQAAVTLSESKHPSVFVAGWRPAVGWTCGLGLFTSIVVWPLAATGARLWGVDLGDNPVDTALLLAILTALLGTSGLRSWEKSRGIQRDSMK